MAQGMNGMSRCQASPGGGGDGPGGRNLHTIPCINAFGMRREGKTISPSRDC